jgi:hypothetical protein
MLTLLLGWFSLPTRGPVTQKLPRTETKGTYPPSPFSVVALHRVSHGQETSCMHHGPSLCTPEAQLKPAHGDEQTSGLLRPA